MSSLRILGHCGLSLFRPSHRRDHGERGHPIPPVRIGEDHLKELSGVVDVFTVPNLCPVDISPYDFSCADQLIERAADNTRRWIKEGGLTCSRIPEALLPHSH